MGEFFAKDYTGAPFQLFSASHLVALAMVTLVNLSLVYWRDKVTEGEKRIFRYALATVLIVVEASWHLWNWTTGQWTVQTMLPLHLCSLFVFLSAIMLVTKSYRIYEFAYFLGIAGASQALLTPDAGIYGFPHFRFFQVILSHGSIVTAAIYMTVVEGYRPTWRSLWRVALWGNLYMGIVGIINMLLGSNYLFIAHKPETASLLDVLPPWPWYLLFMEAIGFLVFLLLYMPFALRDWRARPALRQVE